MNIRGNLSRIYHLLNAKVFWRLPRRAQAAIARVAYFWGKLLFPGLPWPDSPLSLLTRRYRLPSMHRELPAWARTDLENLTLTVDPLLTLETHPYPPAQVTVPVHWGDAGHVYNQLASSLDGHAFDSVLIVPWLSIGGADKAALHHAKALASCTSQRVLVITTENTSSPWAKKLPESTQLLEAGTLLSSLSDAHNEPVEVLTRLLLQISPRMIHVINSRLGWLSFHKHGHALKQQSKLFASAFADEINSQGLPDGYAINFLPTVSIHLNALLTDNRRSAENWISNLKVPRQLIRIVHFPAPHSRVPVMPAATRDRILWAGRLGKEKRLDVLLSLAKSCPELHWDVHGPLEGKTRSDEIRELDSLRNVTLHGSYDDFSDIVRPEHLAMLHANRWDGMPNVAIEAASHQLPVVSLDIGGVADLVPTELLVKPGSSELPELKRIIRSLLAEDLRQHYVDAQNQRLVNFTWDSFLDKLNAVEEYLQ